MHNTATHAHTAASWKENNESKEKTLEQWNRKFKLNSSTLFSFGCCTHKQQTANAFDNEQN